MIQAVTIMGLCAGLAAAAQAPLPTPLLQARADDSANNRTPVGGAAAATAGLTAINVNYTTEATSTLPTVVAPGAVVTAVPGAPAIPTSPLVIADYPALDKHPPTDNPLVQQWVSEIDMTNVPGIQVNGLGGCQNTTVNAQAIANAATNCWWTCSGCTRETDVTFCPNKGDWGLSYDDGPSPYTPRLLDYLTANNLKSTFFVVGSRVLSRPDMLQAEYALGHQICVHTWSHPYLTTLSNEEIVAELGWSKKVIKDTIGVTPNCMRPPYGDIDDRVRYIALQMGLTPIIWTSYQGSTYDTRDWQIAGGLVTAPTVYQNFETILTANIQTGFIVLEHDLYLQSVALAVEYVLPKAIASTNLNLIPINQCLGQSNADSYIETASNKSSQLDPAGASGSGSVPGLASATIGFNAGATSTGSSGSKGSSGSASRSSGSPGASNSNTASKSGASSTIASTGFLMVAGMAAVAILA